MFSIPAILKACAAANGVSGGFPPIYTNTVSRGLTMLRPARGLLGESLALHRQHTDHFALVTKLFSKPDVDSELAGRQQSET
jgi:hypothetical protein